MKGMNSINLSRKAINEIIESATLKLLPEGCRIIAVNVKSWGDCEISFTSDPDPEKAALAFVEAGDKEAA